MGLKERIVEKIAPNVWKLSLSSNLYFLDLEEKIVIDTGDRADRKLAEQFLPKIIEPGKVQIVIFTHLHYDHCGNFDLFANAKFYASKQELESFKKDPEGTVLKKDIAEKLKSIELLPAEELKIKGLEIIPAPGHTKGSICIWMPEQKILFSGDTIFKKGLGRTDLATSAPEQMQETINRLVACNFRTLCAGHDY